MGAAQLEMSFGSGWGGKRRGAGRKPSSARGFVPHRARPVHRRAHPVHVTLRSAFRSLRSQFVFPTVRAAITATTRRDPGRFRVVEFSVQNDHVHLIVEAEDKAALLAGVRGLSIRIARWVNRLIGRRGRFFADRWHGRALTSPRAVRHSLVYVIFNFRKHGAPSSAQLDPCSSAPYFTGFREFQRRMPWVCDPSIIPRALIPPSCVPVARARTWLLSTGWQRHGWLSIAERPAPAR